MNGIRLTERAIYVNVTKQAVEKCRRTLCFQKRKDGFAFCLDHIVRLTIVGAVKRLPHSKPIPENPGWT
jgi:hypothetical protein